MPGEEPSQQHLGLAPVGAKPGREPPHEVPQLGVVVREVVEASDEARRLEATIIRWEGAQRVANRLGSARSGGGWSGAVRPGPPPQEAEPMTRGCAAVIRAASSWAAKPPKTTE